MNHLCYFTSMILIATVCIYRWHLVTVTIDADLGEATSFIDGNYDGYQNGLPLPTINGIWEPGADIWVGARPPIDLDAFGRSDSEGSDSKMQIMDAFLWGRCLSEDEVAALHTAMSPAEHGFFDLAPGDAWHGSYSARVLILPRKILYFQCFVMS